MALQKKNRKRNVANDTHLEGDVEFVLALAGCLQHALHVLLGLLLLLLLLDFFL